MLFLSLTSLTCLCGIFCKWVLCYDCLQYKTLPYCLLSFLSFFCAFTLSREYSWVFNLFSRLLYHAMNLAFVWLWLSQVHSHCLLLLISWKSFSFLPFPLLKYKPSSLQFLPSCFSPPHRLPLSLQISVVNICSPLSVPLNFSFPLLLLSL